MEIDDKNKSADEKKESTDNSKQIKALDILLFITSLYIPSTLISMLLIYDDKLVLENKEPLINDEDSKKLDLSTLLLDIIYFTDYLKYLMDFDRDDKLEILATQISLLGAIVYLQAYLVRENK